MDHDSPWFKFTWAIKNFSHLTSKTFLSKNFIDGGHMWYIEVTVYPKGNDGVGYFIFLYVDDSESEPSGWSRNAKLFLSVINQFDGNLTKSGETQRRFDAHDTNWEFGLFVPSSELHDPKGGFLVDDICMIEAQVSLCGVDNTNKKLEVTVQPEAIPCVEKDQDNSRTSSIAPLTNLTDPLSTLKKCSVVARSILQGFLFEFVEDFPTYDKLRSRILEIESLLGDIEDKEQQSEALQRDALSKIEVSLTDVWSQLDSKRKELQAALEKWNELKFAVEEEAARVEKKVMVVKRLINLLFPQNP